MFEWLEQEIASIKTPRFHVVDGPADSKLREAVAESGPILPPSYKAFVLRFGNARLYRNSRAGYHIGIFAGPRASTAPDGTQILDIGFNGGASVYFKVPAGSGSSSLFEYEDRTEIDLKKDFEDWLSASCQMAKGTYSKAKWNEIKRGPSPFSDEERKIVQTRSRLHWKILGIDAERNHIFEVRNDGERKLHWLTIGLRSRDGNLNGAVRLDVGGVGPGQTAVVHHDCYKDFVPPEEIEAFPLPDPAPEDREYYYEFQTS